MTLRRIIHNTRKSDNTDNASPRKQVCACWQRLRLFPLLKKLLRSRASTRHPYSISPSSGEFVRVARPPDLTCIIPSTGIQPERMLRDNMETSERGSLTIITTTHLRHSRPEPIRRSFTPTYHDPVARVPSGTDLTRNLTLPSIPTSAEFEPPSIGLIGMGITDSPISLQIGENPIAGELENRAPTYGTMFSQYSVTTLPVYREQEDDRMSVVSQTPTYRSRRSTRPSHIPLRSSRLSQPTKS